MRWEGKGGLARGVFHQKTRTGPLLHVTELLPLIPGLGSAAASSAGATVVPDEGAFQSRQEEFQPQCSTSTV